MIRLYLEEYLGEMATIYKSQHYGVLVSVNPDSNRNGNPYFKFYNSSNYLKATKIVRITFNSPNYIVHTNSDGKKLWKLNSEEKNLLMNILKLNSPSYSGKTIWDAAKYTWNLEYLEELINIDDYFKGTYDEKYKDNTGYIPHNLEMPDYTKLNFR